MGSDMADDQCYYERRMGEELAKARAASSGDVRHVHETLASLYRIRLEALKHKVSA